MVRVNSLKSNLASVSASGFQARMAFSAGCSGSPPRTAPLSTNVGLRASPMSEIRLVLAPVKDTFAHDVVEAHRHKAQVDKHLPETEQAGTGDLRQFAVDDRPGHHEDRFHVEQNEEQIGGPTATKPR